MQRSESRWNELRVYWKSIGPSWACGCARDRHRPKLMRVKWFSNKHGSIGSSLLSLSSSYLFLHALSYLIARSPSKLFCSSGIVINSGAPGKSFRSDAAACFTRKRSLYSRIVEHARKAWKLMVQHSLAEFSAERAEWIGLLWHMGATCVLIGLVNRLGGRKRNRPNKIAGHPIK